jgi:Mg2+-importing ATPase
MHIETTATSHRAERAQSDTLLHDLRRLNEAALFARLGASPLGLEDQEAERRRVRDGANRVSSEQTETVLHELWARARNPLNGLLLALALSSWFLGDARAACIIAAMVVVAVITAFVQEHRSNQAAKRLRAMVHTTCSVKRRGRVQTNEFTELPAEQLVAGDIVRLSAGDMIPADLRLLEAKDLFINQSALTGESMPLERHSQPDLDDPVDILDASNLCFMGSNVVSGYGTGVILRTGAKTLFGQLAHQLTGENPPTAFDRGINRFTLLMVRFMVVMVPAVFLINGLTKHNWLEALLFALAVAVGLTPEMLPMIVTVNLAKGAVAMSRAKVIVKRLNAIQNFGAMDVLCTDKTGTLTQDRIILKRHLNLHGEESEEVLHYAFLNSHFQSGLHNLLDRAVLEHVELHQLFGAGSDYRKIDEIPFDFSRRRMSVVVARADDRHLLICKGAIEEVFAVCSRYAFGGQSGALDETHFQSARAQTAALNADGFRVVAVAYREFDPPQPTYSVRDESGLTLLGYIAFLDPPKDTARAALAALAARGVQVKILTGDNAIITRKICNEVQLDAGEILLGSTIAELDDDALTAAAERTTVFAKLTPTQKERIVQALHRRGHVVGFLGDGINDSPALKAADVGISVDTAVDIARESADIILLEKNLLVLQEGVMEGRRVFANIVKYIKMGASSNFGNMLSVLGASLFLPFLPMAPIQVLTNNLLYDFSQTAIPTDNVDAELLATPRRWDIDQIARFMLVIGPVSSLFDYTTFAMMLFVFDAWHQPALFQTGWFVESLLTQTLIIHIIRTAKVPFVQSRASAALLTTTALICIAGILLPYSWLGPALGLAPLPPTYWPLLLLTLSAYAVFTHMAKRRFARRWGL